MSTDSAGQAKHEATIKVIAAVVGFLVAAYVGSLAYNKLLGRPLPGMSKQTVAGLEILSPGGFEKYPFTRAEMTQLKDVSQQTERYRNTGKSIMVVVTKTTYNEGLKTDLAGAAKGMISGTKNSPGTSDFVSKVADAHVGDTPAKRISMEYKTFGMEQFEECLLMVDDSHQWQVQVSYAFRSDPFAAAARKIADSVQWAAGP